MSMVHVGTCGGRLRPYLSQDDSVELTGLCNPDDAAADPQLLLECPRPVARGAPSLPAAPSRMRLAALSLLIGICTASGVAPVAHSAALQLESRIPLGAVRGRIDHLAVDLGHKRLFVAELGNDSVGVIALGDSRVVRTLTGLREPQGIGYVPAGDTLYIANAGDGSVRLFRGANLVRAGEIALGSDADNVRVDERANRLFVGYGAGAIAVIDTMRVMKIADIALEAHPESFQLDPSGKRIFVNVPDAREIAVIDRAAHRQIAVWRIGALRANFPLALDEAHQHVLAIFRHPAKLGVFRARDGRLLAAVDTCRDADDVFVDAKRNRVYVICGEGAIEVFDTQNDRYSRLARIPTAAGARTGLFVPELDRLFVAVRATSVTSPAVWVYRPIP
ncbi:MAG TPA: hypothetical protein VF745_02630 [Steroidobacteraceae bacterium]